MSIKSTAPSAAETLRTAVAPDAMLPELRNGYRREDQVTAELQRWHALPRTDKIAALRSAIRLGSGFECESLVHACRFSTTQGDRELFNLAFEALEKAATPKLMKQLGGESRQDRNDRVQAVMIKVFEAIREGKADFAESNFHAFTKRKSIDVYRKRNRQLEGQHLQLDRTEESDPIEGIPKRQLDPEQWALVSDQLQRLSGRMRAAFVQWHYWGFTQDEIAQHHGVSARTIRNWLTTADKILNGTGTNHATHEK